MLRCIKNEDSMNYKYLHVMTHRNSFFNGGVIELIKKCDQNFFTYGEHMFIVTHKDLKDQYVEDENVVYIPYIYGSNFKSFLKHATDVEIVFLHQNWCLDFIRLLFTPKKIKKKYIWCVWGHDLYKDNTPLPMRNAAVFVKYLIKYVLMVIGRNLIDREIRLYKGIGIGFKYDALEIKKRFKDKVQIFRTPYPTGINSIRIDEIIAKCCKKDHTDSYRVMVGHSAHPYLNHISILDKLSKYKNEPILISLVLVYGNMDYAKYVSDYAVRIFGHEKVEIKCDRMSVEEYISYLNSVDVAIFDQKIQCALGNINQLLYLKKKVFINAKGFIKIPFELETIYLPVTDEIEDMTFEQFLAYDQGVVEAGYDYAKRIYNPGAAERMWRRTLCRLDKNI